ncbi:mechanosensitive ion channel family protein [Thermogladius sp. 4427co]|uniref:mechanosensitive ion channel family protein n=1 Tax=Thermogladius sp. 4427co TaxID=3450718 RepID=UPI003F79C16A
MRKLVYFIILVLLVGITLWLVRLPGILPEEIRSVIVSYFPVIQVFIALILGIFFIELVSSMVFSRIRHLGSEAYLIRNIILISGYTLLGVIILIILGVSGESILAGATFSGLVIGLGLQPVLANLFAGLIILGSGFLKPGSSVRISSTSISISPVLFPAYKAFSMDTVVPSLKGIVIEVGLMYTKILLVTGELVKIPNSTIFSGSIVIEEVEEEKRFQVRYELPVECDPVVAIETIRKYLEDLGVFKVLVEEQSDKNYYIILVSGNTPPKAKLREFRSMVLTKIIQAHRELKKKGLCTI